MVFYIMGAPLNGVLYNARTTHAGCRPTRACPGAPGVHARPRAPRSRRGDLRAAASELIREQLPRI